MATWQRRVVLLLLVAAACLSIPRSILAQVPSMQDVIYLSNGSVIRGQIIEQVPNESLKIKTADGSTFAFKMSEVIKITKEEGVPVRGTGPRREPAVAALLSLAIPGAGQIYNGQTGKGVLQFGAAVVGLAAFSGAAYDAEELTYAGLGLALGVSLWSLIDAPVTASKMNRERGYSKADPAEPPMALSLANIRAGGTSSPGLLVRVAF
jgi:hypothetical protein